MYSSLPPSPYSSWSLNLCGRKHWLLFPPTTTPLLGHRLYGVKELPPDVLSADPKDYPDMHQALEQSIEVREKGRDVINAAIVVVVVVP